MIKGSLKLKIHILCCPQINSARCQCEAFDHKILFEEDTIGTRYIYEVVHIEVLPPLFPQIKRHKAYHVILIHLV